MFVCMLVCVSICVCTLTSHLISNNLWLHQSPDYAIPLPTSPAPFLSHPFLPHRLSTLCTHYTNTHAYTNTLHFPLPQRSCGSSRCTTVRSAAKDSCSWNWEGAIGRTLILISQLSRFIISSPLYSSLLFSSLFSSLLFSFLLTSSLFFTLWILKLPSMNPSSPSPSFSFSPPDDLFHSSPIVLQFTICRLSYLTSHQASFRHSHSLPLFLSFFPSMSYYVNLNSLHVKYLKFSAFQHYQYYNSIFDFIDQYLRLSTNSIFEILTILMFRYTPAIEAFERAIAINPVLGRGALKRHLQQCLEANASVNRRMHSQAVLASNTNPAQYPAHQNTPSS